MRKLMTVLMLILVALSCQRAFSERGCKKYIVEFRFASYEESPLLKKEIFEGRELYIHNEILISNNDFSEASACVDEYGSPFVRFTLNSEGKEKLSQITSEKNIGFLIAVLINGKVYNVVPVREQIYSGKGEIHGSFSKAFAHDVAECLNKSWHERLFQ